MQLTRKRYTRTRSLIRVAAALTLMHPTDRRANFRPLFRHCDSRRANVLCQREAVAQDRTRLGVPIITDLKRCKFWLVRHPMNQWRANMW